LALVRSFVPIMICENIALSLDGPRRSIADDRSGLSQITDRGFWQGRGVKQGDFLVLRRAQHEEDG
jgi:hypothetical protein